MQFVCHLCMGIFIMRKSPLHDILFLNPSIVFMYLKSPLKKKGIAYELI